MLLDDCYISFVNLDHRKDRLARMQQSLAKAGLQAVRTRGMLPDEYKGDPKRVKVMRDRTPGAIGCHFSQVKVMTDALYLSKNAFVMEDDLVFCSDFQKRMQIIDEFCQNSVWDIIWMGGTFHINPPYWHKPQDAQWIGHSNLIRTYGAFCTYAYIVNKWSIARVLAMLEQQLPTSIGIDYAMIQIQPNLYTYAFVPGCITQYDNRSDIGNGVTKFSGFSKLGPYWYQDKLENFDAAKFNWHEAAR